VDIKLHCLVYSWLGRVIYIYSVSKKIPPWGLVAIFPKRVGIFQPNCTCLLCIPIYARLRSFIQLSATLTKLWYIKDDHPVQITCAKCLATISQNAFSDIFPKQLGIFSPNFTCILHVPIYAGLQIFIQLSATLTKLCHIKRDHHNVNVHHRPKRTPGGCT